jgi:hypothetical protein
MVLFRTKVAEPWKSLINRADSIRNQIKYPIGEADAPTAEVFDKLTYETIKSTREQMQVASWYILLDFAKYLQKYLGNLWEVVLDPARGAADLDRDEEKNLFKALTSTVTSLTFRNALTKDGSQETVYSSTDVAASLRDALRMIGDPSAKWEDGLDAVTEVYDRQQVKSKWPGFLFPLADPVAGDVPRISDEVAQLVEADGVDIEPPVKDEASPDVLQQKQSVDWLVALVARALQAKSPERTPPLPLAAQKVLDHREGWFVIRCVYERPNCGPLHPAELSSATLPFQMAGFFDPDAPARPIRIPLPIDTSPAGLRKFDKNTAFMISDMLCGQIKRAKGLSLGDLVLSVLPWPFHKDLPAGDGSPCKSDTGMQLGMICSLSIPIITICALILLMIIVTLLDAIFFWMPYFIICFPLPGFKAKKTTGAVP